MLCLQSFKLEKEKKKSEMFKNLSLKLLILSSIECAIAIDWQNITRRDGNLEFRNVKSKLELEKYITENSYIYFTEENRRTSKMNSEIKGVVIVNSLLEALPSIIFETFSNLETFKAINVSLKNINQDNIHSALKLKTLDLSRNHITRLDNLTFYICKQLKKIILSHNEISIVHEGAFEGISSYIYYIDLSFNKLKNFKEDWIINKVTNKSLLYLLLNDNEIENFVESNRTTPKMNELKLNNNKLKAFERSTSNIDRLDLKNNEIEVLTLNSGVVDLNIENNKLSELFVGNSTRSVNAVNNQLIKFTLENESQLETLLLSDNELGNKVLIQLKEARKLKRLQLSNSSLTALEIESFAHLTMLEELRLDGNEISVIDIGFFSHQQHLVTLNMSNNALCKIDVLVFVSMSSLESLDISFNEIESLTDFESLKVYLTKIRAIGIEGNQWSCDYLSKLKASFEAQGITILAPRNPSLTKPNLFGGFECLKSQQQQILKKSNLEKVTPADEINKNNSQPVKDTENIPSIGLTYLEIFLIIIVIILLFAIFICFGIFLFKKMFKFEKNVTNEIENPNDNPVYDKLWAL